MYSFRQGAGNCEAKIKMRYELHFGQIETGFEQEVSLVAVITENLKTNSTIVGRIFDSLGRNGVDMYQYSRSFNVKSFSGRFKNR